MIIAKNRKKVIKAIEKLEKQLQQHGIPLATIEPAEPKSHDLKPSSCDKKIAQATARLMNSKKWYKLFHLFNALDNRPNTEWKNVSEELRLFWQKYKPEIYVCFVEKHPCGYSLDHDDVYEHGFAEFRGYTGWSFSKLEWVEIRPQEISLDDLQIAVEQLVALHFPAEIEEKNIRVIGYKWD